MVTQYVCVLCVSVCVCVVASRPCHMIMTLCVLCVRVCVGSMWYLCISLCHSYWNRPTLFALIIIFQVCV